MAVVTLTLELVDNFTAKANAAAAASTKLQTALQGEESQNTKTTSTRTRRISALTQEKVATEHAIGAIRIHAAETMKMGIATRESLLVGMKRIQASQQEAIGLNKVTASSQQVAIATERLNNVKNQGNLITAKVNTEESRTAAILQRNALAAERYAASQAKVAAAMAKSQGLMAQFKSNWYQMGAFGAVAGAGFTAAMSSIIKETVHATEVQNFFIKQVAHGYTKFGEAKKSIQALEGWLKQLSKTGTISLYEVKDKFTNLLSILAGSGMKGAKGTNLTKSLIERALDLSSLRDIDVGDILNKFISGLSKQPRTLSRLGINTRDKELEQFAKERGFINNVAGAWKNAKFELKQYVTAMKMLEDSATAIGDMKGTIGQLANAWRSVKERTKEFMVEIGKIIQPELSAGVAILAKFIGVLQAQFLALSPIMQKIIVWGSVLGGAFLAAQFPILLLTMGITALIGLMGNPMFWAFNAGLVAIGVTVVLLIKYWEQWSGALAIALKWIGLLGVAIGLMWTADKLYVATLAIKNAYMAAYVTVNTAAYTGMAVMKLGVEALTAAELKYLVVASSKIAIFLAILLVVQLLIQYFEEFTLAIKQLGAVFQFVFTMIKNQVDSLRNVISLVFGGVKEAITGDLATGLGMIVDGFKASWKNLATGGGYSAAKATLDKQWGANASEYTKSKTARDSFNGNVLEYRMKQVSDPFIKAAGDTAKALDDKIKGSLGKDGDVAGGASTSDAAKKAGAARTKAEENAIKDTLWGVFMKGRFAGVPGDNSRAEGKGRHAGYDMFGKAGRGIPAIAPGLIVSARMERGASGATIHYKLDTGQELVFRHLANKFPVASGTRVNAGDIIGYEGATGNAKGLGALTHMEIYRNGGRHHDRVRGKADQKWLNSLLGGVTLNNDAQEFKDDMAKQQLAQLELLVKIVDNIKEKKLFEMADRMAKELADAISMKEKEKVAKDYQMKAALQVKENIYIKDRADQDYIRWNKESNQAEIDMRRGVVNARNNQIINYINMGTQAAQIMGGGGSTFNKLTGLGGMIASATGNPMIAAGFGLLEALGGLFGGKKKDHGTSEIAAPIQKVEIVKINKDVAGELLGISKYSMLGANAGATTSSITALAGRAGII